MVSLFVIQSSLSSGYRGYKVSNTLTIGGKSTFSFVSNTGNCLSAAGSALFSFKFGLTLFPFPTVRYLPPSNKLPPSFHPQSNHAFRWEELSSTEEGTLS